MTAIGARPYSRAFRNTPFTSLIVPEPIVPEPTVPESTVADSVPVAGGTTEEYGVDRRTIEAYEQSGEEWVAEHDVRNEADANWVADNRQAGPLIDLGCGPGWQLANIEGPVLALDAATTMLRQVPANAPHAHRVSASVDALPFATGSLGGAIGNRVYLHLRAQAVPAALADLHRALAPDSPVFLHLLRDDADQEFRNDGLLPDRLFSGWSENRLRLILDGAGFDIVSFVGGPTSEMFLCHLRRRLTIPDTVAGDMRLLVCGLNPSIYAATAGVGYARPGNRFWPAAVAAGLVTVDRDPHHALRHHGIGMTDLVKRATRRADELSDSEYRAGVDRVTALVEWLHPAAVCIVGLAGWRAAVDRRATAGVQRDKIGGRPVYVLPSTSGLNAHNQLDDFVEHLSVAATVADGAR